MLRMKVTGAKRRLWLLLLSNPAQQRLALLALCSDMQ